MERENAWKKYPEGKERDKVMAFAEDYRLFLSKCKSERECTAFFKAQAEKDGFKDLEKIIEEGGSLNSGDKVYRVNRNKAIALFVIGEEPVEKGIRILGAHIDSPRMDLKQNPLYEDTDLALLDTHYYGGIKKYQWTALPLAIHGVVVKKDGSTVNVAIGEDPSDPVFCVTDLLIHLAKDQMKKDGSEVVEGEALNVLVGSIPLDEAELEKDKKEAVKKNILKLIKEKYDFEEEDFLSAELVVVPAGPARDMGFDRSLILGYGHDDRVCAYPSYRAIASVKPGKMTYACILVDKEEIGSVGATGMESHFYEDTVAEIAALKGESGFMTVRRAMRNSKALSSDVSAAFDPNYPEVMEKKNSAYLGRGLVFNKYTGARGKSGSNDASAEYSASVRRIMDDGKVSWQTAELGKVDQGGGGTIAYILGNYGMDVIDSGVAVLSMHAPWEVISKVDLYEAYRGYMAFLNA